MEHNSQTTGRLFIKESHSVDCSKCRPSLLPTSMLKNGRRTQENVQC
uniref:Uncharacterized protein n=1 Tax=Anguilla anguilla TaxID=7936 RepID=A0A0E9WT94_ANGAN